jgi:hypothetical protein
VLPAAAHAVDHRAWDGILRRYVDEAGLVRYDELRADRQALEGYLASLAVVETTHLEPKEQMAFWINAYNACVFKGVLDHPGIASVKEVKGFFDALRYPVGGERLTLNEIEGKGRALKDWRIHAAVACASSSCPFLRNEAYVAARLDEQLADQLRRFLADPSRGLRVDGKALRVSRIFTWYAKDFVPKGSVTVETLVPLLTPYLAPELAQVVQQPQLTLRFLEYDWSLNAAGSDTSGVRPLLEEGS